MSPKLTVDERAFARVLKVAFPGWALKKIAAKVGEQFRGGQAPSIATISRLLSGKSKFETGKRGGRPRKTTKHEDRRLIRVLTKLQEKYPHVSITAPMLKLKWKPRKRVSTHTISRRLRAAGRPARYVPRKLPLSAADRALRLKWAKQNKKVSKKKWASMYMSMDNKKFTVLTTTRGLAYSHGSRVRWQYRKRGDALKFAQPSPLKHRQSTGQGSFTILAVVGDGKFQLWEEIKGNWCAANYAKIVQKKIRKIIKSRNPPYTLIRDNDPQGYNTRVGKRAEETAVICVEPLPKRSPEGMVLDYWGWAEIGRRMRKQEAQWPADHKETLDEYKKRLRKTALSIPAAAIRKACSSMKGRVASLIKNKGGYIPRD